MENCKIFIVTHKKFKVPKDDLFIPIQVGFSEDLNLKRGIRDNSGVNIADKNGNYCELTALFWLWKNIKNVLYIGICHYRRYFSVNSWNKKESNFLTEKQIMNILKEYDVIVPKSINVTRNVASFYYIQGEGRKKDLDKLIEIVDEKYPDYNCSMKKILNSSRAFYCNMLIMPYDKFVSYCEWLFDILFELEKVTDLTGYSREEKRIYGYLSEILLNVWIDYNQLRIKQVSVVNTEMNVGNYLENNMKFFLRSILNKIWH